MKKILLSGSDGQVGWELQRTLAPLGQVIALTRNEFDLGNPSQIVKMIRQHAPEIIVNAAAYTAVDKAESESELAMQINGLAPGIMAEEAKKLNALLVHYSTDYVFDGTSHQAYSELDLANPLNVYGVSKLAGEQAIQAVGGRHLILRSSWIYGARRHNFLKTMLKLADSGSEIKVVADQIGAPTWCRQLAECTSLALVFLTDHQDSDLFNGVYHLSAAGSTSWHGFAKEIFSLLGKNVSLHPIRSDEYTTAAKRPANSVLSNAKFQKIFGMAMPSWENSLKLCLQRLTEN